VIPQIILIKTLGRRNVFADILNVEITWIRSGWYCETAVLIRTWEELTNDTWAGGGGELRQRSENIGI
jgi:hypothetical protein